MSGRRRRAAAAFGALVEAAIGVSLCIAACTAAAQTAAPIALQGPGPYHRLVLPTAIYARAAAADLSDVRIRNAAGQPVPFAWLDSAVEPTPAAPTASTAVPFFAVPRARAAEATTAQAAEGTALALRVRPDGSLALLPGGTATGAAAPANEWWIDASRLGGDLVQATFALAPGQQGVFPFALDASDDLRRWRPLVAQDALVRLEQSGQRIERLSVELDAGPARYLRLRWLDPGRTATLIGVTLDSSRAAPAVAPALEWSAGVAPSACTQDHCDYPAPRGLPVDSLRITLAEPNVLAPVRISTLAAPAGESRPARPHSPLHLLRHRRPSSADRGQSADWPLADTVLYRLDAPGGGTELQSPPVTLDGAPHAVLRLSLERGTVAALGRSPPVLAFGARPRVLVFLASGAAPFALTWSAPGAAASRDAANPLPLNVLMPGRPGDARAAPSMGTASVTLAPLPSAAVAEKPPTNATPTSTLPWLWASLALGLAVLGAMAWSLLRSLRTGAIPRPEDTRPSR